MLENKLQFDPKIKVFAALYDKQKGQSYVQVFNLNQEEPELSLPVSTHHIGSIKIADIDGQKLLVGTSNGIQAYSLKLNEAQKIAIEPHQTYEIEPLSHRIKTIEVFEQNGNKMILAGRRRSYLNEYINCKEYSSEFYLFDSKTKSPIKTYEQVHKPNSSIDRIPVSTSTLDDCIYINDYHSAYSSKITEVDKKKSSFETKVQSCSSSVLAFDTGKDKFLFLAGSGLHKFKISDEFSLSEKINEEEYDWRLDFGNRYTSIAAGFEGKKPYIVLGCRGNPEARNMYDKEDCFELEGAENENVRSVATTNIENHLGVFTATENGTIPFWMVNEPEKPKCVLRNPSGYFVGNIVVEHIK